MGQVIGHESVKIIGDFLRRLLQWRPRLLPLVIMTASMLLTVKVSNLFQGKHWDAFGFSGASLQAASQEEGKPHVSTLSSVPEPERSANEKEAQDLSQGEPHKKPDQPFDPFNNMTETEVKLLVTLAQRRQELVKKEEDLKNGQVTLTLVEKRMQEKLKELKSLEEKINAHIKNYDEQAEKNLTKLAKFYEQMKPAPAAKVFNQMNVGLIIEIIMRMNASKVPPILQLVDPEKAKELSTLVATRKPLFLPVATEEQKISPSAADSPNVQAPKLPAKTSQTASAP